MLMLSCLTCRIGKKPSNYLSAIWQCIARVGLLCSKDTIYHFRAIVFSYEQNFISMT